MWYFACTDHAADAQAAIQALPGSTRNFQAVKLPRKYVKLEKIVCDYVEINYKIMNLHTCVCVKMQAMYTKCSM